MITFELSKYLFLIVRVDYEILNERKKEKI